MLGLFLPVYADGGSGFDVIWGASGGYLIGFIVATYVIGLMAERGADRKVLTAFVAFVAAQLIVFGIGVPWLKVSADLTWGDAIHSGFTIFILGGLIKAADRRRRAAVGVALRAQGREALAPPYISISAPIDTVLPRGRSKNSIGSEVRRVVATNRCLRHAAMPGLSVIRSSGAETKKLTESRSIFPPSRPCSWAWRRTPAG